MAEEQFGPSPPLERIRAGSAALLRRPGLRNSLRLVVAAALIGVVVYSLRFSRVPVTSHRAGLATVIAETMGTGTLEARVEATISPKIQGRLIEVLVDQNDRVDAGQVLARLEDAEWIAQVDVARADLDASIATVTRVRADEARARAVLAQARLDYGRASDLNRSGVTSRSDLDRSVELLHVAEADLARSEAAITESARQQVVAEMNLAYHRTRLADTKILSPFAGLVVQRDRDPGDMIVPGSAILHLVSTGELWISAWIDETAMPGLAPGQAARVVFRSEPAKSYPGEVARLGRQTDRETREFLVDIRVEELPGNWAVGQRAEVFIETARRQSTLVIPPEYVLWAAGGPGAFIDDAGIARWRELELGLRSAAVVEVRHGLQEGQHVVKPRDDKQGALADGDRIKRP